MAKTILILGGAGFIGSHIVQELARENHNIIVYDNFSNFIPPEEGHYPYYLQKRLSQIQNLARIIRGDIRDKATLVKTIKETKPEVVINLVAIPLANASTIYFDDAIHTTLNGHINLMEAMRETNSVKRIIYTSTSFVYGNFDYEPADEDKHPTRPVDIYGGTKLSCEILTKIYAQRFGLEYVIIRPSAVYGPTDANLRVTQLFVQNAILNKPLFLSNGGLDKVDFTYVTDTAHGFCLAALSDQAKNQTFNITAGLGRSAAEFAEILRNLLPEKNVQTVIKTIDEKRPIRGALDISKAKNLLGYEPEHQLEAGLKKYLAYIKDCGLFESYH